MTNSIFRQDKNHSSDDLSDGISVISEGEVYNPTITPTPDSDIDTEKSADEAEPWTFKAALDVHEPLTPPSTPHLKENNATNNDDTFKNCNLPNDKTCCSKMFIGGSVFFLAVAILFSKISSLQTDISALELRISRLEQENLLMRAALQKLESGDEDEVMVPLDMMTDAGDEAILKRLPPKTKTVWLGESEDKVQILDKKSNSELPDYCYFLDENDDLFYEYNQDLCERKRQKIILRNKKNKNSIKDLFKDDLKLEGQKSYDDYVTETLKSLNDEIQEIKRKRVLDEQLEPLDEVKEKVTEKSANENVAEKSANEKRREYRDSKRSSRKHTAEWSENRVSGREEARRNNAKQQKQENLNWYIKRKNEREALRSDSNNVNENP